MPQRAAAALVTPAHQFPLGPTLAPERRAQLISWSGLVIEDDYDGEFRYDRQPVGALQGLAPEHVIYAGTASKTLSPALRLGWLVLPEHLLEPVLAEKRLAGPTQVLDQLALAELIRSRGYDRHVRRMRQRYRRRRDRLLQRLAGRRTRGIAAGLHLVLELDEPEPDVIARARAHELAVGGLGPFWHDAQGRASGLVIGYGSPPEHQFEQALDALTGALQEREPADRAVHAPRGAGPAGGSRSRSGS